MPTEDEWQELKQGFESICGFPDAVLAIDRTLIRIDRLADWEKWYCRKGYPAFNTGSSNANSVFFTTTWFRA